MKHQFSYFAGRITDSYAKGITDIDRMIMDIKNPDEITLCIIDEIRECTDDDRKGKLKAQLKGYTPAVIVKGRRTLENVQSYSGYMALDFDKLPDQQYAIELREFLFKKFPFIICSWLSASGKGVRAIMSVDQAESKEDYQSMFEAVRRNYMADYEFVRYFDNAPKNVVLVLYQSYDPDLLYRKTAQVFTDRYIKPEPSKRNYPPLEKPDNQDHLSVQNMVIASIDKIKDNGHPQLRGASLALGGYVGAGYIAEYEAIQLMHRLIEQNSYLSKKPGVYKKTATEMIKRGTTKPLYL